MEAARRPENGKLWHHGSVVLCLLGRIHGISETPRGPHFTPSQHVSLAVKVKPSLKLWLLRVRLAVAIALRDSLQVYVGFVPTLESRFRLRPHGSLPCSAVTLSATGTSGRNIASGFGETLLLTSRMFLQTCFSASPWSVRLGALYWLHSSPSAPRENQEQKKGMRVGPFLHLVRRGTQSLSNATS